MYMSVASMAKATVKLSQDMGMHAWSRVMSKVKTTSVTAKQKHHTNMQKVP